MRRILLVAFLALPVCCRAASVEFQVTPKNAGSLPLKFKVDVAAAEDAYTFTVTVRANRGKIQPRHNAHLVRWDPAGLAVGDRVLKEEELEDGLRYTFRVTKKEMQEKSFRFTNRASDSKGRPMPSADFYILHLKLFV